MLKALSDTEAAWRYLRYIESCDETLAAIEQADWAADVQYNQERKTNVG